MGNYRDFFRQPGGHRSGGNARLLWVMRSSPLPWVGTPDFIWRCTLLARELARAEAFTQVTTITVPALDPGRTTLTFSGGPLPAPVVVVADQLVGEDETDLATAIAAAVEAEAALDDYVAAPAPGAPLVFLNFTADQGLIEVTATHNTAPVITFAGTLRDGPYATTFTGGGLVSPVTVTTTRTGAVPSTATAMAVQHEADIEAEALLTPVVGAADDDGAGANYITEVPDIPALTITTLPPRQSFTLTAAGTASNGLYSARINHPSLPNGYQPVTFTRAAAETNTQIADGLEASIESNGALSALIESADNVAGVCTIVSREGVSGLSITDETAPGTGTLAAVETSPTMDVSLDTVGTVLTVAHYVSINLETVAKRTFPTHVTRGVCTLARVASFGAGRAVYVGHGSNADALMESTPVSTTGRVAGTPAAAEYAPRYEAAFHPRATLELGSSIALTAGHVEIQIEFAPAPGPRIAA